MSISSGSATLAGSARRSARHRLVVVSAMAGVLTLGAALVPAATFAFGPAEGEPSLVSGQLGEIPVEVPNPDLPLQPPSATLTSELLDAAAQVGAAPAAGSSRPGKATPGDAEGAPAAGSVKSPKTKPAKVNAGRIEGAASAVLQRTAAAGSSLDSLTLPLSLSNSAAPVREVTGETVGQRTQRGASPRAKGAQRAAAAAPATDDLAAFYGPSGDPIPPLRTDVLRDASVQIDAQQTGDAQPLTGLGLALIPLALAGALFAFRLRPAGGRHAA
ncbi:MAG: hypothetical protein ACT4P1_02360 [Sporichthyaceae bacterium]